MIARGGARLLLAYKISGELRLIKRQASCWQTNYQCCINGETERSKEDKLILV